MLGSKRWLIRPREIRAFARTRVACPCTGLRHAAHALCAFGHPSIIALREAAQAVTDRLQDVEVTYITSRGNWYHRSWKGQVERSGGFCQARMD